MAFQCVLGFQPPLFPWDDSPTDVPTVGRMGQVQGAGMGERQPAQKYKQFVDCHRGETPQYKSGDTIWLATKDIKDLQTADCKIHCTLDTKISQQTNNVTSSTSLALQPLTHFPCILFETHHNRLSGWQPNYHHLPTSTSHSGWITSLHHPQHPQFNTERILWSILRNGRTMVQRGTAGSPQGTP